LKLEAPGAGQGEAAAPARFQAGTLRYSAAGLALVVFWLLVGELGIAMRDRWALPSALELLRRNAASDTTTSLLLSTAPALLSLFLVPFVGYHSDRYRSRWGRRRPFLVATSLAGAAAMAGVAATPMLGQLGDAALGAWSPGVQGLTLGLFCLFWTVFECAAITTLALFSGLVNDVVPRPFLGRFYAIFRVVGLSVGIAFNQWVFALTDAYLVDILMAIALIFGLALPLMCLMVREGGYPPDAPAPAAHRLAVPRGHILECFAGRRFLWSFAAFMLAGVTFGPFNTFYQHYALLLGVSKATLGSLTAWSYAVSIVSAFGIGALVDRHGPLKVSALAMGLYCATAAAGYLAVGDAASFRYFYVAHVVMSGAYFTAAQSLPMALFPNSQFVRYNSTKDVMVALASIVVSISQGPILDLSGHAYQLTLASASAFSLLCVICLARVAATPGKTDALA